MKSIIKTRKHVSASNDTGDLEWSGRLMQNIWKVRIKQLQIRGKSNDAAILFDRLDFASLKRLQILIKDFSWEV